MAPKPKLRRDRMSCRTEHLVYSSSGGQLGVVFATPAKARSPSIAPAKTTATKHRSIKALLGPVLNPRGDSSSLPEAALADLEEAPVIV
eukprot:CAMPEP_0115062144 /NCGR_PEP_ID=MMETSP0227-20121206/8382_1 /TAXON_ID=89957 /ORGANISM="Polarella glacialis, Strain CCMP 1383" /LENGTH=88 /DNA_ID=CAMNT_0002447489 /DNA_START=175 /DNA_END=441 /DNA_ORIENTATION=-